MPYGQLSPCSIFENLSLLKIAIWIQVWTQSMMFQFDTFAKPTQMRISDGPNYFKGTWQHLRRNMVNVQKWCALSPKVNFFDLGSAGGTPPPFCWIPEWIKTVNFEPDPRGVNSTDSETLPIAIGPNNMTTLYLNRRPTTSSLLKPCQRIVERYDFAEFFKDEVNIFETIDTQQVQTFGLDEIVHRHRLPQPDFLKIDVQGLSLEVLQSAVKCLDSSVLGILIEVEFIEAYMSQKTFGHVHEFLYQRNFEIFKLSNLNRWFYKTNLPIRMATGQDVFCDLLYFRNIDSIVNGSTLWNESRATKTILLFLLFDLIDTAAAYYEKFLKEDILSSHTADPLEKLITGWYEALRYFYRKKINIKQLLLDLSVRQIIRGVKSVIQSPNRTL